MNFKKTIVWLDTGYLRHQVVAVEVVYNLSYIFFHAVLVMKYPDSTYLLKTEDMEYLSKLLTMSGRNPCFLGQQPAITVNKPMKKYFFYSVKTRKQTELSEKKRVFYNLFRLQSAAFQLMTTQHRCLRSSVKTA